MRYVVRWEDGLEEVTSDHDSEEGAKKKARLMSKSFQLAIVAGLEGEAGNEKIAKKWTFEDGKQTDSHLKPDEIDEEAIASESTIIAEVEKEEVKAKKKKPKAEEVKSEVESTNEEKENVEMSPKTEKFVDDLGLKMNTIKRKMAVYLLNNIGKQMTVSQLGRASYGNEWKADGKSALFTAWGGLSDTIKKKKVGLEARKEKVEGSKEVTFGLHAK